MQAAYRPCFTEVKCIGMTWMPLLKAEWVRGNLPPSSAVTPCNCSAARGQWLNARASGLCATLH